MIKKIITPYREELFERKVVRANGYKCVMSWWINGYGVGSLWFYDRNGKLVIHATIDRHLSYKEIRHDTKSLGITIKHIEEVEKRIAEENKYDQ